MELGEIGAAVTVTGSCIALFLMVVTIGWFSRGTDAIKYLEQVEAVCGDIYAKKNPLYKECVAERMASYPREVSK